MTDDDKVRIVSAFPGRNQTCHICGKTLLTDPPTGFVLCEDETGEDQWMHLDCLPTVRSHPAPSQNQT